MSERRPTVLRRDILKIGGSATLLPLASVLGLTAPIQRAHAGARAGARAFEFKSFDRAQAGLLLSVARTLFPHDFLPDEPEGEVLRSVAGIGVDSRGAVFVFHRAGRTWPDSDVLDLTPISRPTVDIFDGHTGILLKRWGANLFAMPHGLTVEISELCSYFARRR